MKKLSIALLTVLFVLAGVGTALSESATPISNWNTPYEPDFELVFKGALDSEYLDKNSICFMNTKSGVDTNMVAVWIKYEFTPDGINNRISVYKKNQDNSSKYDNFSYSYNCVLYDLKNNKYTTIRFVDFDKSNNIINETKKPLDNLRWFNVSRSRDYTIDTLKKYTALNYDAVLSRSINKKSE